MSSKRLLEAILFVVAGCLIVSTTSAVCTVELQNAKSNSHVVVEECRDAGTFSIGGHYGGNWERLTYNYNSSWAGTFLTVKVGDNIYSNSKTPNDETHMDAYLTEKPYVSGNSIIMRWRLPENILVTQTFEMVSNGTRISVGLENEGEVAYDIGVRFHMDTMLGMNDGAPIYIPGDGLKSYEADYSGSKLNFKLFKAYNRPSDPTIVATGIFDPDKGFSYPGRIVVGEWKRTMAASAWYYDVDTSRSILGDSSVLIYYDSEILDAGKSRTISFFYGSDEPVLTEGEFGLGEIVTNRVPAEYCPAEDVVISVDAISAAVENRGHIKLEVKNADGRTIYTSTKSTGIVQQDSANTLEFRFKAPRVLEGQMEKYDVKAFLLNSDKEVIDTTTELGLLTVDDSVCKSPIGISTRGIVSLLLILLILLFIILALVWTISKTRKVVIVKVVEGGKVKVIVQNKTNTPITDCVIEDPILYGAEVHVSTIGVERKEDRLIWGVGTLHPKETAVLEYMIKEEGVLPKATVTWDGGSKISE